MLTTPFDKCMHYIAKLLSEAVTDKTCENDDDITDSRMDIYVKKMNTFRDAIYADAKESIVKSQQKQKREYDEKRRKLKVYMCDICKNFPNFSFPCCNLFFITT